MSCVTIGMPVYNGAATMARAIASMEAQTHDDFTVIAADNRSTDGSWDMLQDWAARDARVTLHRHGENIGALGNFRYVLDRAGTDRFMWHACDDWASPNYVETLDGLLDANPDCGLACGDVVKATVAGGEKRRRFPDLAGASRLGRITALLKRPRAPWIYGLFKKDDLSRALSATERFGYAWGGDFVTLMAFILEGRVCGSNATAFHYRMSAPENQVYRPADAMAQLRFFAPYLAANLGVFARAKMTPLERAACLPYLLRHISRGLR